MILRAVFLSTALCGAAMVPNAATTAATTRPTSTEFEELEKAYTEAERSWIQEIQAAPREKQAEVFGRHPAREYWQRFQAHAEQKVVGAHIWLMENAMYAGKDSALGDLCRSAFQDVGENETVVVAATGVLQDSFPRIGEDKALEVLGDALSAVGAGRNQGWIASTMGVIMIQSKDPARHEEGIVLLESIASEYDGEDIGQHAADELFRYRDLAIGAVAPGFEGKDIDGASLGLSEFRGKIVVLDFFGFW